MTGLVDHLIRLAIAICLLTALGAGWGAVMKSVAGGLL